MCENDNSYILAQISGLMQLRRYVNGCNYTYIDQNEQGINKVYAYQNTLLEMIDSKIESLTMILKNRCMVNTNNQI